MALRGQQPGADDPVGDDQQVFQSTPTAATPAASINFRKDLNLPYPSLGSRIDAARRASDPVALGHAAGELDTAEQVSGRTASLTSKTLISEAAELARVRKQEAEMRAVLHMSNKLSLAEDQLVSLKQSVAFSQGLTAKDQKSLSEKEEPTSTPRKSIVNNYSQQYIDIHINGFLRGQVSPGATRAFTIDQRWNPIVLKGWGNDDSTVVGPKRLQGRFTTFTWNINGGKGLPDSDME